MSPLGLFGRKKPNKFKYASPLDSESIRLVRFASHGRRADKPELELSTHGLVETLNYHALSYTWGPPEGNRRYKDSDLQTILLNGEKVYVFPSLYDALVQLRESNVAGYYWIDAICIDQYNRLEREIQVSIMDRIYVTATQVDIWVGKGSRDSAQVFDLITKLASMRQTPKTAQLQLNDPEAFEQCGLPPPLKDTWEPFITFFERNWFKRSWIVQEVALARKSILFWGGVVIPWDKVSACTSFLVWSRLDIGLNRIRAGHSKGSEGDPPVARTVSTIITAEYLCMKADEIWDSSFRPQIELLTGIGKWKHSASPFLAFLLQRYKAFDATDERDKIFSLLGIVNYAAKIRGAPTSTIKVDYSPQTSTAMVFTAAVATILEDCNHLGLLAIAGRALAGPIPGLPSWVPDFSTVTLNPIIAARQQTSFDPSRYSEFGSLGLRIVGRHLYIKAFQLGTISAVSPPLSNLIVRGQFEPFAALILQSSPHNNPTAEHCVEIFWRTLVCNTDDEGCPAHADTRNSFAHWLAHRILTGLTVNNDAGDECLAAFRGMQHYKALLDLDDGAAAGGSLPSLAYLEGYLRRAGMIPHPDGRMSQVSSDLNLELNRLGARFNALVRVTAAHRRLFVTRDGHMGLGVETTAVGDSVWVVSSCPALLTLRVVGSNSPDSQLTYRLISDAYVHGMMHGEVVDQRTEWKEICIV